jgi:hypothetical protein
MNRDIRCRYPSSHHLRSKSRLAAKLLLGIPMRWWFEPLAHLSVCLTAGISHSLIVLSPLPEANALPSGLYATDNTPPVSPPVWPWMVASSLPGAMPHSLIVLSQLPEARVLPSGLYTTATTDVPAVCPLRVVSSFPVATSHNLIVLSRLPEVRVYREVPLSHTLLAR